MCTLGEYPVSNRKNQNTRTLSPPVEALTFRRRSFPRSNENNRNSGFDRSALTSERQTHTYERESKLPFFLRIVYLESSRRGGNSGFKSRRQGSGDVIRANYARRLIEASKRKKYLSRGEFLPLLPRKNNRFYRAERVRVSLPELCIFDFHSSCLFSNFQTSQPVCLWRELSRDGKLRGKWKLHASRLKK